MDRLPGASVREPLLAFCAATALAAAATRVPFLRENLHAAIALIFLYAPAVAARLAGGTFDYREAGLRVDPMRLNLAVLGLAVLVVFPLFVTGFFAFYGALCGPRGARLLPAVSHYVTPTFARLCRHWLGWQGGRLHLPGGFLLSVLSQIAVVAIPEELFFRGYLMTRLERRWRPTRTFLGAPVGMALVVSSALFAIGHIAVVPNPQRLAVFFPALLFGWMRARTGSIAPGALFHALCNLLADVLHTSYFY